MATVTTNQQSAYSNLNQLIDKQTAGPVNKPFSLHENKLDGTYYPIDSSGATQHGWWGTSLSDATGAIAASPSVTVSMSPAEAIHALVIAGYSPTGEYPVDFKVELFNGSTLLHTENVTGNASQVWKKNLPQTYMATSYKVTVTKVNKAGRPVKLLEADYPFELKRTETLSMQLADDGSGYNLVVRADTLSVTSSETKLHTVLLSKGETLSIETDADSSFMELWELRKFDSLGISQLADASTSHEVSMTKEDTLGVIGANSDESSYHEVRLVRPDSLGVDSVVEDLGITKTFTKGDTLRVQSIDTSLTRNIYTIVDDDFRVIKGKVEISYTDPFIEHGMTSDASTTAYNSDLWSLSDGMVDANYKWFNLQSAKLDGTFHPIPSYQVDQSIGWWGTVMSDSTGMLPTPEVVTFNFRPRTISQLLVQGDSKLNEYPVDFTIRLYNSSNVLLYTEAVTGNSSVAWRKSIAPVADVARQEITITKALPNRNVKLLELYTSVVETYEDDELIAITLLEEQQQDDMTLPIGNVSSNELVVTMDNSTRRFDPTNKNSPLYGFLKRNRKVQAWLGMEIIPGTTEWYSLGVFWTQDWSVPSSGIHAETVARDRLELLRQSTYTRSVLWQNTTLYDMAVEVLVDAGLAPEDYDLDPELMNVQVPWGWFDRMSHKAALTKIAAAGLARLYCDRMGRVVMRIFQPLPNTVYTFTPDTSIIDIDHPLQWAQVVNQVEVTSSPLQKVATSEEIFKTDEPIVLGPNEILKQEFYFTTVPAAEVEAPIITFTGGAGSLEHIYEIRAWGIEITFVNNLSTTNTVSSVEVWGKKFDHKGKRVVTSRDEDSIYDNGVQSYAIENEFIQDPIRAKAIADDILAAYKDPRHDVAMETRGSIALTLGDRVGAPLDEKGTDYGEYYITRQNIHWEGSLEAKVDAQKIGG
jgi:hypothetical protein